MARANAKKKLLVGVDVGGTKILAALVKQAGKVIERERISTPQNARPAAVVTAIVKTIRSLLDKAGVSLKDVAAIGLAIPGVVDPEAGRVVVTPNMNLTGLDIVKAIRKRLNVPVTLGNDVNLGTLGEKWLGAARNASSAVGVFVGTGIGGGVIVDGRLLRGFRESAGEVGHLVMEIGGPKCGCGSRGCFEAIASRTAIDRNIRAAIAAGKKSIISELVPGKRSLIRSGAIRKALAADDKVVVGAVRAAAEVIGHACLSIRHLLDPEVIVLGGGVIEACGQFMLPIIEKIVEADPLTGARPGGRIVESALGDDAVVWGAVALAQQSIGLDPFRKRKAPGYPKVKVRRNGQVEIGRKTFAAAVFVNGSGEVGQFKKSDDKADGGADTGPLAPRSLQRVCEGTPEVLFLGARQAGKTKLPPAAATFLHFRRVEPHVLPLRKAVKAYNACKQRKAILLAAPGK